MVVVVHAAAFLERGTSVFFAIRRVNPLQNPTLSLSKGPSATDTFTAAVEGFTLGTLLYTLDHPTVECSHAADAVGSSYELCRILLC